MCSHRFQNRMNRLCKEVEQFANEVLITACNEIDQMDALQCMHYLSAWPLLKHFFQKKTADVYESIIKDIKFATKLITINEKEIFAFTPKYSGVSLLAVIEFKRITVLNNVN